MDTCWVCGNDSVAIAHAIYMYKNEKFLVCVACKNNIEKIGE